MASGLAPDRPRVANLARQAEIGRTALDLASDVSWPDVLEKLDLLVPKTIGRHAAVKALKAVQYVVANLAGDQQTIFEKFLGDVPAAADALAKDKGIPRTLPSDEEELTADLIEVVKELLDWEARALQEGMNAALGICGTHPAPFGAGARRPREWPHLEGENGSF
jgi:hypothetical protein